MLARLFLVKAIFLVTSNFFSKQMKSCMVNKQIENQNKMPTSEKMCLGTIRKSPRGVPGKDHVNQKNWSMGT